MPYDKTGNDAPDPAAYAALIGELFAAGVQTMLEPGRLSANAGIPVGSVVRSKYGGRKIS